MTSYNYHREYRSRMAGKTKWHQEYNGYHILVGEIAIKGQRKALPWNPPAKNWLRTDGLFFCTAREINTASAVIIDQSLKNSNLLAKKKSSKLVEGDNKRHFQKVAGRKVTNAGANAPGYFSQMQDQ